MKATQMRKQVAIPAIFALLIVGILAQSPAGAAASSASEPTPPWPLVSTTTVVTALGTAGTTVSVPAGTALRDNPFRLRLLDGGQFAFAMLARRGCGGPEDALCASHRVVTFATPGRSDFFDGQTQIESGFESELPEGIYDIYVVTDKSAELGLTFAGAPGGETRIEATGKVDAVLERLTPQCPLGAGDCSALGYGSAIHPVRRPGIVVSAAVAYNAGPGHRRVANCLDPWFGGGSAGTADPAFGCATLPTEPSASGWNPQAGLDFVTAVGASPAGGLRGTVKYNNDPDGNVLAGYIASEVGAGEGGHAGWGVWINGGIS